MISTFKSLNLRTCVYLFMVGAWLISTCFGCYSFQGFSISEDTKTYTISSFPIDNANASLAPPDLGEQFAEAFKEKVRRETRLIYVEGDGDIEFTGKIAEYKVTSVAPQGSDSELQLDVGSELSRLSIKVNLDYKNTHEPDTEFKKDFEFFADFNRDQNLGDVQDELTTQVFERLLEDIFNAAFTNW